MIIGLMQFNLAHAMEVVPALQLVNSAKGYRLT